MKCENAAVSAQKFEMPTPSVPCKLSTWNEAITDVVADAAATLDEVAAIAVDAAVVAVAEVVAAEVADAANSRTIPCCWANPRPHWPKSA